MEGGQSGKLSKTLFIELYWLTSSCRHRIAGKLFFSFLKPLLTAVSALAESNKCAGPRPTAVAIPSSPQLSNQHITIIQVSKQQWDALMKRCTTLEDQVARLSEQLASRDSPVNLLADRTLLLIGRPPYPLVREELSLGPSLQPKSMQPPPTWSTPRAHHPCSDFIRESLLG